MTAATTLLAAAKILREAAESDTSRSQNDARELTLAAAVCEGVAGGRGAWYFISRWYCVLCGHSTETRERRYGERPADPAERCDYTEGACGEHFC